MRSLIRWAKAVADGDPLTPDPASPDPEQDRVLRQFQLIAEIARLHRNTAAASAAADASASWSASASASAPASMSASASASASATQGTRPTGEQWGHLTLAEPIGAGSFGTVYRAWDPRLERLVALKLLYRDDEPAASPQTAAITEGRLLARLRHPNVVSVYGADRIDDRVGVWMELIHGRTLEEIVTSGGPLGAPEASLVGLDCCRALAAIHQAGLIHRDLKPRNVMRERGGRIIVMDLGAARLRGPDERGTATPGKPDLVGTPLYLAPEIFRGEPASVRSDIYSLGVLLYFLVTGTTPVTGANAAEVAAHHAANERQALREARPDLPEAFITAIQRALSPEPQERFASAAAFAEQLARVGAVRAMGGEDEGERRAAPSPRARLARGAGIAALMALAAAGGAWLMAGARPAAARPPETRLLLTPTDVRIDAVAASPDGRRLAFAGTDAHGVSHLWLRPLDAFDAVPLADTAGATYPFWSPDGGSIGYFAQGRLWIISAAGGTPRALAAAPIGRGATWGRDGQIVFAPSTSGPLFRVSAEGGEPAAVTTLDAAAGDTSHRWPVFLPDGRQVAFLRIVRPSHGSTATFVTALDGQPPRKLADATTRMAVTRSGVMLFAQDTRLLAQQLLLSSGRVMGEPRIVTDTLASRADTRDGVFSLSADGALTYGIGDPVETTFDVYDRQGQRLYSRRIPGTVRSFALSPDGRQLLLERLDPAAASDDIWTLDLQSDRLVRLTMDPANDTDPIWSPDGREVLFSSDRLSGQYDLFRRSADPGGQETLFSSAPGSKFAEDWSADGETLALVHGNEGTRRVSILRVSQPNELRDTATDTTGEADEPAFSPDGSLLAYHSSSPGLPEVFVAPMAASARRWQVSPRGGVQPRWRADGAAIFYLALDGTVMAAPVLRRGPGTFSVGTPHAILATGVSASALINDYAITRDGARIVVRRQAGGQVTRLAVILDWHSPFD